MREERGFIWVFLGSHLLQAHFLFLGVYFFFLRVDLFFLWVEPSLKKLVISIFHYQIQNTMAIGILLQPVFFKSKRHSKQIFNHMTKMSTCSQLEPIIGKMYVLNAHFTIWKIPGTVDCMQVLYKHKCKGYFNIFFRLINRKSLKISAILSSWTPSYLNLHWKLSILPPTHFYVSFIKFSARF